MNSWQLLFPAAWAALGLIPILVLAYLRQQPRDRQIVPSLILLRKLSKQTARRKQFRPPLNFLFELLALLALTACALHIIPPGERTRVAIIVDTSLSTRASLKKSDRLQEAKSVLTRWISEQGSNRRYTLFTSAPTLTSHSASLVEASAITTRIDSLTSSAATDTLESQIDRLARSGDYDVVTVVTDREVRTQTNTIGKSKFGTVQIEAESVPLTREESQNVYLAGIRVRDSGEIVVEVGATHPAKVDVSLGIPQGGTINTLQATVEPTVVTSVVFPPLSTTRQANLTVRLSGMDPNENRLTADDVGWLTLTPAATNDVLIVTESGASFGLERLKSFRSSVVTPATYSQLSTDRLKRYSFVIFDRCSPSRLPSIPTLFVLPPEGNPVATVHPMEGSNGVTSWIETHPLTAYLKIPLLSQTTGIWLDPQPWLQGIIRTQSGPILVAGERDGIRSVAVGFQIFPFEGESSALLSVLTLNIFRWLNGGVELSADYRPGSNFRLAPDRTWVIAHPDKQVQTIDLTAQAESAVLLDEPGLWSATSITGQARDSLARETVYIPVNAFFPNESRLELGNPLFVPSEIAATEQKSSVSSSSLWKILLWVAVAFLVADFATRLRARRLRAAS